MLCPTCSWRVLLLEWLWGLTIVVASTVLRLGQNISGIYLIALSISLSNCIIVLWYHVHHTVANLNSLPNTKHISDECKESTRPPSREEGDGGWDNLRRRNMEMNDCREILTAATISSAWAVGLGQYMGLAWLIVDVNPDYNCRYSVINYLQRLWAIWVLMSMVDYHI